jgi:2-polyprenyl-3-methyl-5-hydroxy-6-metoxy-1,4-benzoquinol methylase
MESEYMKVPEIEHLDLKPMLDPLLSDIRKEYLRRYAEMFPDGEGKGLYLEADWRRLEFALSLIPAGTRSVLEIGVGPGQMLNYLTMCGRFSTVTGIDIRRYSRYIQFAEKVDFRLMSVDALDFEDRSFDVVLCMEVLEHLPTDTFNRALPELRRVTNGRLIMSVPFEEPEPLPTYHKQRFDSGRIQAIFPKGQVTLLHRPRRKGWPWALIVEDAYTAN